MASDAYDSDVLIYIAKNDPLSRSVRESLEHSESPIGSVVLIPEVLSKAVATGNAREYDVLVSLLSRLDLKAADIEIADASALFGAKYRLRAADAIHLATAVVWGAERFHTNNRKDFGPHIEEIDVVWPSVSR